MIFSTALARACASDSRISSAVSQLELIHGFQLFT